MFDELDRLKESLELLHLLTHYAEVGAADRQAWQDRLMSLKGVEPKELVKLHGELIAYTWVVQNTGVVPVLKPGTVAGCYRITAAGMRALRQARGELLPEDEDESEAPAEKIRATVGASNAEKKSRRGRGAKGAEAAAGQDASSSTVEVPAPVEMTAADSSSTQEDRAAAAA